MKIQVEVSAGELLDKISILEIKLQRIRGKEKLEHVKKEYDRLVSSRDSTLMMTPEVERITRNLKSVNERLWLIEDEIRMCERSFDFGDKFIQLARSVYHENDLRAKLKRDLNLLLESDLIEEKSYISYPSRSGEVATTELH
jgi:hypothetical protein